MAEQKPPSSKRKLIKGNALRIFKRKRADMDQGLLKKIRDTILASPLLRKQFGVEAKAVQKSSKQSPEAVAVNKAHNMEVLAKLMAIKPESRGQIKEAIKESED